MPVNSDSAQASAARLDAASLKLKESPKSGSLSLPSEIQVSWATVPGVCPEGRWNRMEHFGTQEKDVNGGCGHSAPEMSQNVTFCHKKKMLFGIGAGQN